MDTAGSRDVSPRLGRTLSRLVDRAHLLNPADFAAAVAEEAGGIGVQAAVVYLVDYEQTHLVPVPSLDAGDRRPLDIDATLAGRAFRTLELYEVEADQPGTSRAWVPLLDGTARLGVLEAVLGADPPDQQELRAFAGLVAELLVARREYGDTVEFVRRRRPMTLAAEIQWHLLPPLTCATEDVAISGALEPAHSVAGDSFDYAVNGTTVHVALFDAMGHGLDAALMASLAVAAYRNERRSFADLGRTVRSIDAVVADRPGEGFVTAVVGELDLTSGRLTWVCAGHPSPLLLRNGRVVKVLDAPPWRPLGVPFDGGELVLGREDLEPGDRVLFFTDGFVEARRPDGGFFTVEQLGEFVSREDASGLPAPEVLRRLTRALLLHHESRLTDDATVVLLEWRGDAARAFHPSPPD